MPRLLAAAILLCTTACRGPSLDVEPRTVADRRTEPVRDSALAPPAPDATRTPTDAIVASLEFLRTDGDAWMRGAIDIQDGKGCVSCHHVGYAVWSHTAATQAGIAFERDDVSGAPIDDLTERAMAFVAQPDKGRPVSWTQLILGRPDPRRAPDDEWSEVLSALASHQQRDGRFRARGQFPTQRRPIAESDAVTTMWALAALDTFELTRPDLVEARDAAMSYVAVPDAGQSTEWLAARALVAALSTDASDAWLGRLLTGQNPDGGFGFLPGEASDALTTGQALYALTQSEGREAERAADDAVAYLLATQGADGTWSVASRLISTEPTDGKDYIYRYWGTAWAAIGLARQVRDRARTPAG